MQTKLWYVKTAAFELFSDHVGRSKPAGVPTDAKALSALAMEAVQHVTSSSAEVKAAAIRVLHVMHDMRPDLVARTLSAQNTTNADHEEVLQVCPYGHAVRSVVCALPMSASCSRGATVGVAKWAVGSPCDMEAEHHCVWPGAPGMEDRCGHGGCSERSERPLAGLGDVWGAPKTSLIVPHACVCQGFW